MSRLTLIGLGLLAGLCGGCRAAADEPPPTLRPGATVSVSFPELPPTFEDQLNHTGIKPQMTVYLPTNYDPARKFPLLIFLSGGGGGSGGNPSVARGLCEDKDFVCVNLPLFKEHLDPATPTSGVSRILIRDADAKYAWPCYQAMLARLDALVPNLDPAHQVLGGFSNGAHMTAGLVNQTDGAVAARFSAFFLVDGGGGLNRFDLLKDKPLLDVCGRWRPNPAAALAAGVKLSVYRMKVPEHAFPASEYPVVRDWLRDPDGAAQRIAAAAQAEQQRGGLKVGDRAPAFRLRATDGREYALTDFTGKSAVALCWYLRAGSSGSRTELGAIQAVMPELARYRLQVLGVTLSQPAANRPFADELKLSFPLLSDPDQVAAKAYGTLRAATGPTGPTAERWVMLIDDQGIIRSLEQGEDVESKGKLLLAAVEAAKIPARQPNGD